MHRTFEDLTTWPAEAQDDATEEKSNQQLERFIALLQEQAGGPRGYRLRRILLTNFWLYGQQAFEIPHGRLFLAGENASGKSTVLTAALPLALDGDLRPNRLDTFGGRERHIEYYILGSADSATPYNFERRTAYIALEFEWCDTEHPPIAPELRLRWENGEREQSRFLTIGISLAGNVNSSDRIRPMRFLITDGSRLGYELDTVYETGAKHDKRAYDQPRFKQLLEGHGIVCDSQADYERQVGRYLFGFADEKDFQKLISFLLVLRRPNLSTELSFSRVHDYLKQSLRKISGETTSRVIGTIERIDSIQGEIERIQEAFDAAERLHRARQSVALARTQLAACEYLGARLTEDSLLSRVTKLRRDLTSAENERKKAAARAQSLQAEQHQLNGQIKGLEASEGLQVARQLSSARERARETGSQMLLQQQSLASARHSLREQSAGLERQRSRFDTLKRESAEHLRELAAVAAGEALWDAGALQLQETARQVSAIATEAVTRPEIPVDLSAFIEAESEDRMSWLHSLEELHRQRESLETRVQYARSLETTSFQEMDEARRRFQNARDRAYDIQQQLNKALEPFFAADTYSQAYTMLDEVIQLQAEAADDESSSGKAVEQLSAAILGYRKVIDTLESDLREAADQAQSELNELQLLAGSKGHEIAELQALYEQKLAEPEYAPPRSARRILARQRLSEQGIASLPLYALLDFATGIDSESEQAGRIEFMLEDAGLLDALVVAPAHVETADAILAEAGLGDCRLRLETIRPVQAGANTGEDVHRLLRFDSAAQAMASSADSGALPNWEQITNEVLASISFQQDARGVPARATACIMREDGSWTHGLLTGRAGGGTARLIGKATRLRERQRELAELDQQRATLEHALQALHSLLADYEQQLSSLQEKQAQLRKVLPTSGLEEVYAELFQGRLTLDESRSKYQKARQQTQELRQSFNALLAQLEKAGRGVAALATDAKRVQSALFGAIKLKNQARSLHMQLTSIVSGWEELQQAKETCSQAKTSEANTALLFERIQSQLLQAQAEEQELLQIAASTNVEELSERLTALRKRSETLSTELEDARSNYVRADERANNSSALLAEVEVDLQQARAEREEKQQHFLKQLSAYPVEKLAAIQQTAPDDDSMRAARQALGETLPSNELQARKERLEEEYRGVYNTLARTFNREQPLLLEYGPDLDDEDNVIFLSENRSRPVELLALLSERIEMQKTLLGQEERQLFEDFLLQEIAEAIRTHIFEAEEWVQQVNHVLSGLPMIGEHYALQWKPPAEYDLTKLGSHLAQHYKLLRKPVQTLTTEEAERLMAAFRQEIQSVRLRQQENPEMNFMEALEQVFDYREWFHFDVLVTPIGGQRQRLTDRMAGTRSGAEQLFALYVPLFAALAALYRTASPGAPRLLALDEAFDKVSAANTQRIMEFLVSQDFQWIMTGPQISGAGSKIPACARYLMLHEKGSPFAGASASFWSDSKDIGKP